jgi:3-deoxy-D-manno-octulosonate 8-phosphate phosphatase (KDO 8-P phosphatase)
VDGVVNAGLAPRRVSRATGLAERARRVRLLVTDCDGVLTDGSVYYSDRGEAMRRFSVRDGMGVERLCEAGISTAILTRERSEAVVRRAQKLGLPHLFLGVHDKGAHLPVLLRETGLGVEQLAYIGDDVNDLGLIDVLSLHGLTAAPADAMPDVRRAVHYHCACGGGRGAFREFAEWILRLRDGSEGQQMEEGA